MKTMIGLRIRDQASAILICLLATIIVGMTLASYLMLTGQEYQSVCRSQDWNRTIPLAEAGVEDALGLLNKYTGTTNALTSWTNIAAADGWTLLTTNVYQATRYVGQDYYTVYLTNLNNAPTILSIATVAWNYSSAAPQTLFAAAGVPSPPPVGTCRAVLAQTAPPQSYYLYGILAKKDITISGGGTNDSVNSLDPNYAGNPWSTALEHANGSIGTIETGVKGAFNESSSTIFGHVNTGAGSTATVSGGSGGIGDLTWLPSNGGKIESGWVDDTLNITIPDAPAAPTGVVTWPMPAPVKNTYILTGTPGATTYYAVSAGMNISGGATVIITNGPVTLICAGDFTLSGGSGISITPGSSLVAYFNGKTTLSGGGVINGTGYATNCTFYGSANCTSVTYSGSSGFIGTVWAPYAVYTQSGGSGVIGALIVYSFTQSGGKSLMRYDEALGGNGAPGAVYRVVAWQEVKPGR